jgi:DNA invertase Pin-like site-specific DNA recombinase
MSKAIYGHLGGSDALLVTEVARLRRRVAELEDRLAAYESELVSLRHPVEVVTLSGADLDVALRELGKQEAALT